MKNTFLGSMVGAALLAVTAVGCAPLQQATGDDSGYYEPDPRVSSVPSRVYVEDPYFPGRQILMERDPFTGRYYPVAGGAYPSATYGGVYRTPAPYGAYDPYSSRGAYRDPRYARPRGGYRHTAPAQYPQQRADQLRQQEQRRQDDQRRSNAADEILKKKQ